MRYHVTPADLNELMSERHQDQGVNLTTSSGSAADRISDRADNHDSRTSDKKRLFGRVRCRKNPYKHQG